MVDQKNQFPNYLILDLVGFLLIPDGSLADASVSVFTAELIDGGALSSFLLVVVDFPWAVKV